MATVVYSRSTGETQAAYLKRALHAARDLYPKHVYQRGGAHASFPGVDTLKEVQSLFPDLDTFGVEGFCGPTGERGVSYLNTGDSYADTICFESERQRFVIRSISYYTRD